MQACPSCGEDNPDRARFCLNCATPLGTAPGPPREVRKTVTVVFSDVTGSTSLGERLDPESLRRVMTRYFDRMRAVLERHGGTVEKFIGDAVMAVFGIPTLHEDDALRAVRAADEMRRELASLNVDLERDHRVTIDTRTGVNTGEVVAGDPSGAQTLVTGDPVNTAARLEQAARPGEVLVGEATYRLVRDAVKVEPAEAISARGKAEPVPAYRLLEVAAGAAGFARRLESPLVGRERELRLLRDALDRTRSERACHLFTILGPAGVGKSRLVQELAAEVASTATVLRGRCLPYGEGITYWPVIEMIRTGAGIGEEDSADEAREKLRSLVHGEHGDIVAERIAQVMGLVQDSAVPEETFWAVRRAFESLARTGVLVAIFDDLHWAEPTLLDLIEHLADWTRDAPMVLLCVARPELLERRRAWAGGKLNTTTILLEPLPDDAIHELMDNLLGGGGPAEVARARIAGAAEGNPLFVEELVSMLVDDGALVRTDAGWEPATDLSGLALPPTIHALIAARLDRLEPQERATIGRAAVEGKLFHVGSVAAMTPEDARPAVPAQLMALVRKELIRPEQAELPGEDAFRFRHMLIRDAAYESLPKQLRADLHERVAGWLEEAAGDRSLEYEEIVAYHLEQAHRYRSELGPVDERGRGLGVLAAEKLSSAGRRAMARGDARAGVNLLSRAAAMRGSDAEPELLLDLGMALVEAGDLLPGQETLAEAERRAGTDDVLRRRAAIHLALSRLNTDPDTTMEEVKEQFEAALPTFERAGDEGITSEAMGRLGELWFWLGNCQKARDLLERAADAAERAGDPRRLDQALAVMCGVLLFGPWPVDECLAAVPDIVQRSRNSRHVEAAGLGNRAIVLAMLGRFEEARQAAAAATAILDDLGLKVIRAMAGAMAEGLVEELAGDLSAAERIYRDGVDRLRSLGETAFLSTLAPSLADVLCELDRLDEALELTDVSRETAAEDDFASQVAWRVSRSRVMARRGLHAEALRLAEEAVEIVGPTDYLDTRATTLAQHGEVLALMGRRDEAVAQLEKALELLEAKRHLVLATKIRERLQELRPAT